MKGSAMSLNYRPTVDELLADSLIRTVMRADHVETHALRSLLHGVASRIRGGAGSERASQRPAAVFVGSPNDRRTAFRGGNAPSAARLRARVGDSGCGSAVCC
jgi:hypothetical protein